MKHNHVTLKCPNCGRLFKIGYNGVRSLGAASLCDPCANVERDARGLMWHKWEDSIDYIPVDVPLDTDQVTTITRAEAFR